MTVSHQMPVACTETEVVGAFGVDRGDVTRFLLAFFVCYNLLLRSGFAMAAVTGE